MATRSVNSRLNPASPPKTSVLGLIFFLMGAPNLYSLLQKRSQFQERSGFPRIITIALFAGAIASAIELAIL